MSGVIISGGPIPALMKADATEDVVVALRIAAEPEVYQGGHNMPVRIHGPYEALLLRAAEEIEAYRDALSSALAELEELAPKPPE